MPKIQRSWSWWTVDITEIYGCCCCCCCCCCCYHDDDKNDDDTDYDKNDDDDNQHHHYIIILLNTNAKTKLRQRDNATYTITRI